MKLRNLILAAVAAVGLCGVAAQAAMVLDFRVSGTGAKTATVDAVGDTISIDVYGVLPNANAGTDSITVVQFGAISTGTTLGNYTAAIAAPDFSGTGHQDTNGPTTITPNDRDADTDLDIGGASNASATNWFGARAGSAVLGAQTLLGTFTWQVTSLGAAGSTVDLLPLIRVAGGAASFVEDGTARNGNAGNLVAGAPLAVSVAAVPEPAAALAVAGLGAMGLLRRRR